MDSNQFQQMMQFMTNQQAAQQQQLVAALQQVQHQQQMAAAAAAAAAPPAAAPAQAARPRIPAASSFSGSASHLDGWLREMKQQFEWYRHTADAEQVALAAAHLKGVALDWWSSLAVPAAPAAAPGGYASEQARLRASFDAFEAALRGRFQPVNSAQTARLALDALRQGARQSVHDYISAFRRLLVPLSDMSERDRVHRFVQGLRGPVQQHLIIHDVATLDAAISMAARVGSLTQYAAASSAAPHAAATAGGDAMELSQLDQTGVEGLEQETGDSGGPPDSDAPVSRAELHKMHQQLLAAMQQQRSGASKRAPFGRGDRRNGAPRVPGLSVQQVRERMDSGLCLVCGQPGHRKYDCPQQQSQSKHQSGN
jgi:hypothetical protein